MSLYPPGLATAHEREADARAAGLWIGIVLGLALGGWGGWLACLVIGGAP
jgi:hypothetical protein